MTDSFFLRRKKRTKISETISEREIVNESVKSVKSVRSVNTIKPCMDPLVLPGKPWTQSAVSHPPELTIFGFSSQNEKFILSELEKINEIISISHGTNFIKIRLRNAQKNTEILEWNRKVFNEEIIGVYQSSVEIGKVVEERNWLKSLIEYLFGRI